MREELRGFSPEELEQAVREARAEHAAHWDKRLEDETDDLSDLQPVKVKTAKRPGTRATVGLRLSAGELGLIEQAARTRGVTFSEFVREAALVAASGGVSEEAWGQSRRLSEMRVLLREFESSIDRLLSGRA